jgi:predicted MFS family arabinose efflux permease
MALVAFVEGTFFVFFTVAESAALPHLVAPTQIPAAIAQNQARQEGADLVGQPLGGVLFGIGRAVPFLFDAVSYGVSFIALLFVRPSLQEDRPPAATRLGRDIVEGVTWLWRQAFLRTLVLIVAGWNFVSNALVLALIVRAEELGASPALIGLMLGCFGAGAIIGSLLAPAIQSRVPGRVVFVGATWIAAVAAGLLVPMRWPLALGAIVGTAAIVGPVFNVVFGTYRYALTPDRLQGRVVSAGRVVAWGAIPLGSLTAGFLLEKLGATTTLALLAGAMVVVALAATVVPSVRHIPALPDGRADSVQSADATRDRLEHRARGDEVLGGGEVGSDDPVRSRTPHP